MDLKERQILIFKNIYKNDPKHPDATGFIEINGEVKELALWNKRSKGGKAYTIGSWNEPYNKDAKDKERNARRGNVQEDDGSPF